MTAEELHDLVDEKWSRAGTNRVSSKDLRDVGHEIIYSFSGTDNPEDTIPDWTSALTFNMDGTGAGKYCKHPDTGGNKRIFETKTDGNINHEPPTNPEIHSDAYWNELSPSSASAIVEWKPGAYGSGLVIVFHHHSQYEDILCKLLEPSRPFTSSNIETEINSAKWSIIGSRKYYRGVYPTYAALVAAVPIGNAGDFADVDPGPTTDILRYIWDTNNGEWIQGGGAPEPIPDASSTTKGITKLFDSVNYSTPRTDGAVREDALVILLNASFKKLPTRQTLNISGAVTIDLSTGDIFELTLTGNVTSFSFSNAVVNKDYIFIFKQDTSYKTLTWAAGKYRFPSNNAPILTDPTTNGTTGPARSVDIITAFCGVAGRLDIVLTPNMIEN